MMALVLDVAIVFSLGPPMQVGFLISQYMKKILLLVTIFALGVIAGACTKSLNAEETKIITAEQFKSVIYNYQRICDQYIRDDYMSDVVCEGNEWDLIVNVVGDPYNLDIPEFWKEYENPGWNISEYFSYE